MILIIITQPCETNAWDSTTESPKHNHYTLCLKKHPQYFWL